MINLVLHIMSLVLHIVRLCDTTLRHRLDGIVNLGSWFPADACAYKHSFPGGCLRG